MFRCESTMLRTHWVLLVMDQFTPRIAGFGAQRGSVDGEALCRMLNQAIQGQTAPKYLSTDNDPFYRFRQWQANLRVLEVTEIKTVPCVPLSHKMKELKNPYAGKKKAVGINLSPEVVDYFKALASKTGLPYQKLIDLYLLDCAKKRKKLTMKWVT
jgi:predicted DNA binding CopG/RHH family protein